MARRAIEISIRPRLSQQSRLTLHQPTHPQIATFGDCRRNKFDGQSLHRHRRAARTISRAEGRMYAGLAGAGQANAGRCRLHSLDIHVSRIQEACKMFVERPAKEGCSDFAGVSTPAKVARSLRRVKREGAERSAMGCSRDESMSHQLLESGDGRDNQARKRAAV